MLSQGSKSSFQTGSICWSMNKSKENSWESKLLFIVCKYVVSSIQKEQLWGVFQSQSMKVCIRGSVWTPDISKKLTKLHFESLRKNSPMIFFHKMITVSNGTMIEYLLDIFLAGSKLTRFRVCLSSLCHPQTTRFCWRCIRWKHQLSCNTQAFLFNDLQQKTTE